MAKVWRVLREDLACGNAAPRLFKKIIGIIELIPEIFPETFQTLRISMAYLYGRFPAQSLQRMALAEGWV